jgi:hypothetical protein
VIDSRQDHDGTCVILARAPLAELFGYATDLRERTAGAVHSRRVSIGISGVAQRAARTDRESMVGAPLKPTPNLRVSGVALPEPDDAKDDRDDDWLLSV